MVQFRKATRAKARLRLALCGPAGSGKSYTGLRVAMGLLEQGERLAVIDTEHGSAELYADQSNPDGGTFEFDCVRLDLEPGKFSAENYIDSLHAAAKAGYPVVLVDSLSHAWAGEGGVLDYVDNVAAKKGRGGDGNKFAAWRQGTKAQNELVDALLSYPGHVVCTLRTKVEFVLEKDEKGRSVPRKVGMQSVQRDGVDYEFTVVGDIDVDSHRLYITKSRCSAVADRNYLKAGADLAGELKRWLDVGEDRRAEQDRPRRDDRDEAPRRDDRDEPRDDAPRRSERRDRDDDRDARRDDRQPPREPGDDRDDRDERPAKSTRPTDDAIAFMLGGSDVPLTRDECDWYAVTYAPTGLPLARLTDEQLRKALAFFTSVEGGEKVRERLAEFRADFQRSWFAKWKLLYPPPRKADVSEADFERITMASERDRKAVFREWYGCESLHDIPVRPGLKGPRNLAWLKHVPVNEFEQAVRDALGTRDDDNRYAGEDAVRDDLEGDAP